MRCDWVFCSGEKNGGIFQSSLGSEVATGQADSLMLKTPITPDDLPKDAAPDAPPKHAAGVILRLQRWESALKNWLSNKPIRNKLKWLLLIVCNATLMIAAVIYFSCDFLGEISRIRSFTAALGKVLGVNSRLVLSVGNKQSAAPIMDALTEHPSVIGAGLYQADGTVFARTMRPGSALPAQMPPSSTATTRVGFGGVRHIEPITENGKMLGTLVIETDIKMLYSRMKSYAIATLFVLVGASLFGRWLASRLDSVIVDPIVELSSVAKDVAASGKYSLRAKKLGEDEVGQLVEHFNTMLGEIQQRDEAISEAQIELETKVFERTSELHKRMAEDKNKQELIAENESRYRNLFENNPMPMFVVDLESLKFLAVNNAAMKHYGFLEEEFLQRSLTTLTNIDDPQKVVRAFRSSAKSFNAGEWKHRRKSGGDIDVELTAHAILFAGKVAKIILANDVTAKKEAQQQLEVLHRKLMETSRQAGMAEVATGVLHNVGNVLNSVNVSATVLAESVKGTKAGSLARVVELLETNRGNLPAFFAPGGKGQMLPEYLSTLNKQIAAEQAVRLEELSQLTKNIAHIKDIVSMQQNYAKVTGVMENHSPRVLVDEALKLAIADNERDGVTLELNCPSDIPEVYVDRHKVMQILVNLLTNARQAMLEQPVEKRLVFVQVSVVADVIRISIRDNGCGISPDNLTRIFNHGFTTKKTGHGFGLHSAANSAREMGGQLYAESEGVGFGATFHLELAVRKLGQVGTEKAAAA